MRSGKKAIKKILITIVIVICALAAGCGIYYLYLINKINHFDTSSSSTSPDAAVAAASGSASGNASGDLSALGDINTDFADSEDVINLLLIGCDQRSYTDEEAADPNAVSMNSVRTDTIILCSINQDTNQITLISFMRDLYVPIPGYSSNRINTAYTLGGKDLLVQTIEQDFGVPIDGTVAVNLDEFLQVMNVIGDIEIDLTEEEAEYINDHSYYGSADDEWPDEYWYLTAGTNTLTPNQALAYARVRKFGNSDYDRTTRQRKFLYAVYQKVASSNILKQLQIANKVLPCLTTDMASDDLIGLAYTVFSSGMEITNTYRIPADGAYTSQNIAGMSVLVPDLTANSTYLKSYIYNGGTQEANIDESTTTSTDDTARKELLMDELKQSLQSVQESWSPEMTQEILQSDEAAGDGTDSAEDTTDGSQTTSAEETTSTEETETQSTDVSDSAEDTGQ